MSTDDELRNIFQENVEPVEPPPGIEKELAGRVSASIAASGGGSAISIPFIVALAAISGLLIGGLLGFIQSRNDPVPAATLTAAPIYACPGDGQVGTLHRGDRVVLIGQSGDWVAVRNVRGSLERVFIHADHVTPDAAADLPEASCSDTGVLVIAGEEIAITTTTTTMPDTTTTTDGTGAPSTTEPTATTSTNPPTTTSAPTTTSTSSTTTTTTTVPPDTTDPAISSASRSEPEIFEVEPGISCPTSSTISATVTDNVEVTSVVLSWSGPGSPKDMSKSGDTYSASFGTFSSGSWPDVFQDVTITITARDAANNTDSTTVSVRVWRAGNCLI